MFLKIWRPPNHPQIVHLVNDSDVNEEYPVIYRLLVAVPMFSLLEPFLCCMYTRMIHHGINPSLTKGRSTHDDPCLAVDPYIPWTIMVNDTLNDAWWPSLCMMGNGGSLPASKSPMFAGWSCECWPLTIWIVFGRVTMMLVNREKRHPMNYGEPSSGIINGLLLIKHHQPSLSTILWIIDRYSPGY